MDEERTPRDAGSAEGPPPQAAPPDGVLRRFVGNSALVCKLREDVLRAAETDFPVLVLGETGTGKNIVARMLHDLGARGSGPFVTVYCPCLARGLVESELFGYRRGAFTGALNDREGKAQAAEGGTLFLDEIGDLPLEIQPRLLRLLQDSSYEPVGDPVERRANIRLVAATNHDLAHKVRHGLFRWDLYERLNFLRIEIPPLRQRREDVPDLLRHALSQYGAGGRVRFAPDVLARLARLPSHWPGNVRDVQHLAARLATLDAREPVSSEMLEPLLDFRTIGSDGKEIDFEAGLPALMAAHEKKLLTEALRRFPDLDRKALATKLRISRAALFSKLRRHGVG